MKAIRRSLKNDKERERESRHQHQTSLHHKSATAIIPPKKVIKALYDYEPTSENGEELAFRKGDFFHVISREEDTEWYEACNPLIPTAKGLVPVAFFEIIGKQQRQSGQSVRTNEGHDSGFSEKGLTAGLDEKSNVSGAPRTGAMHSRMSSTTRAGAMVYGEVLYDFQAERPDELDAKSGEAIIVVAQSNPEWFVAKPIGRLGGPGLIPVSFVQIKDIMTKKPVEDPVAAIRAAGVPRVEEWKKTAAEYKNSSISLGQINTPQIGGVQNVTNVMGRMSVQDQQRHQQGAVQQPRQQQAPGQHTPRLLAPISASVPRYCFDNDMYWYIIECQMEDGRWWELSRYYADFYDFQVALLEKYPEEAGMKEKQRTLPYMPGPVAHVTDAISNGRRQNLDDYIKKIIDQPSYIREDILVRQLFAPKPGQDWEIDPTVEDDYRLSGQSLAQVQSRQSSGAGSQNHSAYGGMPPPGSARNGHQTRPSQEYHQNGLRAMPPPLHSQASNLTQNSTGTSSSATAVPSAGTGAQLRVKVQYDTDTLAIRVPENIDYTEFRQRVKQRLGVVEGFRMQYMDDERGTTVPLTTEDDLSNAKGQRNFRVKVEGSKEGR